MKVRSNKTITNGQKIGDDRSVSMGIKTLSYGLPI